MDYDLSFNNTFSVGDFNDDGLIDVFSSNVNFFDINNVYLNTGDSYFDDKIELAYDDQRFFSSQFIDMDMDGDLDILASGRHLILFENGLLSSTEELDIVENLTKVYPTVTSDLLTISSDYVPISHISIVDIDGKVVQELNVYNRLEYSMSVASLANGTYYIQIKHSDNKLSSQQFFKM